MIVTEYMENGALDRYLKVSPTYTSFIDENFFAVTSARIYIWSFYVELSYFCFFFDLVTN